MKKHKPFLPGKKSKGFTLVEVILIVSFISLTSMGIYFVYQKLMTSNQVKEALVLYELTFTGVQGITGGTNAFIPEFATLTYGSTYYKSILPGQYINGSQLLTPFGAAMNVGVGSGCGYTNCQVWLTMHEVPVQACALLLAGLATKYNVVAVSAPTAVYGSGVNVKNTFTNIRFSPATAATTCEVVNVNSKVAVTAFVYKFTGN